MTAVLDAPPEVVEAPEAPSAPLVTYTPSDAAIAQMRGDLLPLAADEKAVRTTGGYEKVRLAIGTIRNLRVGIEKRRKELKEDSLKWGRKVDAEAARLTASLLEIEEPLKALKQTVDEEKERKRKEAEEAERAVVEAEIRAKREAEEARLKALRDAEEERLRVENARIEAENRRLAEDRRKLEAETKAAEERQRANGPPPRRRRSRPASGPNSTRPRPASGPSGRSSTRSGGRRRRPRPKSGRRSKPNGRRWRRIRNG
jgi:hypothetical protein